MDKYVERIWILPGLAVALMLVMLLLMWGVPGRYRAAFLIPRIYVAMFFVTPVVGAIVLLSVLILKLLGHLT
jgi:uncharacterized membrane protein